MDHLKFNCDKTNVDIYYLFYTIIASNIAYFFYYMQYFEDVFSLLITLYLNNVFKTVLILMYC